MSLTEELILHVASKPPQKVEEVAVGQAFTVVKLVSGEIGLALTPLTRFDSCIGATRLSGKLTHYDTTKLAGFFNSGNAHLRAVGLAAINTVLQQELKERTDYLEGDFLQFLNVKPGDNVAMIDYYTTKIEFLKGSNLMIFDDRFAGRRKDISIFPLGDIPNKFREADVVIVPPAFLDKTEDLRKQASRAKHFVVVHPTVPPLPGPFFNRGVTMVASMMILDPESVFEEIMEGAGTTIFKKHCKKIAFQVR